MRSKVVGTCRGSTDSADGDEAIWFCIGEGAEQDAIHNAEEGGGGAGTHCKGQNAGEREGRMPPQLPEGEVQIAREGEHALAVISRLEKWAAKLSSETGRLGGARTRICTSRPYRPKR